MKKIITRLLGITLALILMVSASVPSYAYTVKKGDTISKIAKEYGTTVKEIRTLNNLKDADKIYIGQELKLPNSDMYGRVNLTAAEKKTILSLFDAEYYAANNPDVVNAFGTSKAALEEHFLKYGLWEARQANANFNVNAYASAYDDLANAFADKSAGEKVVDLYMHYVERGITEGRNITTIEACLESGHDVHYYGAYNDNTAPTAKEAVLATVPVQAPTNSVPTTYVEACRQAAYTVICELADLYMADEEYWDNSVIQYLGNFYIAKTFPTDINIAYCMECAYDICTGLIATPEFDDFLARTDSAFYDIVDNAISGKYSDWDTTNTILAGCPSPRTDYTSYFYWYRENESKLSEIAEALGLDSSQSTAILVLFHITQY